MTNCTVNVVYIIQDKDSGNSRTEVESVDYNPICREQLINWLYEVGFTKVDCQEKSGDVEFVAIKP